MTIPQIISSAAGTADAACAFGARDIPSLFAAQQVPYRLLDCVNWPSEFPYCPETKVAMAVSDEALLLHFCVREQSPRAVCLQDHGHVWEDSCVECFVGFPDGIYYNIECNCLGVLHLAAGPGRHGRVYAPEEVMAKVGRWASLAPDPSHLMALESAISVNSDEPDQSTGSDTAWEIALSVPFEAFFLTPSAAADLSASAGRGVCFNCYKCGGQGALEHYVSLFPVPTEKPDFHRPEFFAEAGIDRTVISCT